MSAQPYPQLPLNARQRQTDLQWALSVCVSLVLTQMLRNTDCPVTAPHYPQQTPRSSAADKNISIYVCLNNNLWKCQMQKRWGEKRSRDKVEVETVGLRIMSPSEHLQRRSERVLKVCAVAKNLMAETKDQGSGRIRWGKKKKKRLVGERVTSHQAKPCAAPSPHTTLSCKCWSVVMEVGGGGNSSWILAAWTHSLTAQMPMQQQPHACSLDGG